MGEEFAERVAMGWEEILETIVEQLKNGASLPSFGTEIDLKCENTLVT